MSIGRELQDPLKHCAALGADEIVSIDAVKDGMQALIDGKINYIVECNPLLGDLAAGLVKDVLAGKTVEKATYVEDASFTQEQAAAVIADRKY